MNYQTHIHKFAPLLSQLYVQTSIGYYCCEGFSNLLKDKAKGKFDNMDVMHHLLSGYKSLFSERILESIEICRKSCGGAGYSAWSGLPRLYFDFSPVPTYEGDNTVMLLQSANFLKKLVSRVAKGVTLPEPFTYLNNMQNLLKLKNRVSSAADLLDLDLLEEALSVRACALITDLFAKMKASNEP